MSDQTSAEEKLRIIGRLQMDPSPESMRAISQEMQIPYSRLLKYRKELEEATANGDISALVDVDQLVVHRVAEEVKQDLIDIAPTEGELIEADVEGTVGAVNTYNVLNDKLQVSALLLTERISKISELAMDPKEILILVESLTKIQTAFFNKQVVNLNMLNQQNTYSSGEASAFSGLKRR